MTYKKKIVGGVVAASMLVALVPAATALADDSAAAPAGLSICDVPVVGSLACATITYLDENGTTLNTQVVEKGSTDWGYTPAAREGVDFIGWFVGDTQYFPGKTQISRSEKLVGRWQLSDVDSDASLSTFVVTVHTGEGKATDTQQHEVTENTELASVLPEVTRDGYEFVGWTYDEAGTQPVLGTALVTGSVDIYGQWKATETTPDTPEPDANAVEVTFYAADGETKISSVTMAKGTTFSKFSEGVKAPAVLDKVFAGWTLYGSSVSDAPIYQSMSVVASYTDAEVDPDMPTVARYEFTVKTNGGVIGEGENAGQAGDFMLSVSSDEDVLDVLNALKVTREGYTLKGWSYEDAASHGTDSKVQAGDKLTKDGETIVARWDANDADADMPVATYTMTAHTNGGAIAEGEFEGQSGDVQFTVAQNDSVVSALPKVTRLDYVFKGWTYDAEGKNAVASTDVFSADTEIFAQWEAAEVDPDATVKTFTMTAHTNGGTIAEGEFDGQMGDVQFTVAENDTVVSALPKVTRDGYTLTGWTYDAEGKNAILSTDAISADTEVFAQWAEVAQPDEPKDDETKDDTSKKDETKADKKKSKKKLSATGAAVTSVAVVAVIAMIGGGLVLTLRKRA